MFFISFCESIVGIMKNSDYYCSKSIYKMYYWRVLCVNINISEPQTSVLRRYSKAMSMGYRALKQIYILKTKTRRVRASGTQ